MNDDIVLSDLVKYELMVIIRPDLAIDAITARLGEIRKLLASKKGAAAGEIFFEDVWGMRNFAYRIKKNDHGFYAVFDFTADPSAIKELETTLTLEPEILRHMIVKLPFTYEPKSFAVVEEEKKEEKAPAGKDARPVRKPVARIVKKEDAAPASAPAKVEEPKVEEKSAEKTEDKPRKKETTLEDVDAKLKSIIENPDINF